MARLLSPSRMSSDVTLSRLNVENFGTDDAIDVLGSSDISLTEPD